jgi:hypothetical protein
MRYREERSAPLRESRVRIVWELIRELQLQSLRDTAPKIGLETPSKRATLFSFRKATLASKERGNGEELSIVFT